MNSTLIQAKALAKPGKLHIARGEKGGEKIDFEKKNGKKKMQVQRQGGGGGNCQKELSGIGKELAEKGWTAQKIGKEQGGRGDKTRLITLQGVGPNPRLRLTLQGARCGWSTRLKKGTVQGGKVSRKKRPKRREGKGGVL